ncbi:RdgB/HAM1 family non-canonical purine NTP pyrophosphatase [uncultured Parolsenella sp.]|uniref:RdgB/HAM1 family non-canonical purine NTP pyrophosphatase n=1 Tax=uncultured Parolsenella sp. TaxID=2083008 RepID=UPI0025D7B0E0|nr:RdgB/HAM1 family non-canonical purine NTP pyrophosphatase [uncultured Parolsenella sp.]
MPKVDYKTLDPATTVVVATGNAHKVTEIEAILKPVMPGTTFYALGELGDFPDPVENGDTFTENAIIKAQAALDETGLASVADDSGLVVDALGGEPGIMSARWAGVHGDDARNNAKMMREMADVPEDKRGAHFHSSVVLLRPDGTILTGEGDCHGKIGHEPEGTHGFGYDPLFWPDDTPGRSMADLEPEEKNAISHRFHALQDLARQLA